MLNMFRENLKSLKWLLWLVAISMTLFLGNFFMGSGPGSGPGSWAAKVDGTAIPAQALFNLTQSMDRQYQQLFGEQYSQMRSSLRLGTQAIDTLIQREVILVDARDMGIHASKTDVAHAIRENPAFQGADGNFVGTERYTQLFTGRPGGVAAFEEAIADDIIIQRWEEMIGQAVSVGDSELEDLFRQRTEKTAIKYGIVTSADRKVDTDIDADQISSWYDAHATDYQRDERRKIRYVVVNRQAELEKVTVSDDEINTYYEANIQSYERPEQRKARHILLRVAPDATEEQKAEVRKNADAILERVKGGEDFATVAQAESTDTSSARNGGDLGWFGKGAMVPPFEQATFGTTVGEFAPVTETQFGFHIIQVTEARDAGTSSVAEVHDAIERNLKVNAAQNRVESESQRLSVAIATAADIESVATAEGLTVEELLVTEEDSLSGLGASPEFLPAVFSAETGSVTAPLRILAGMAIVAVDEVVPAGLAPLEDVESQVRTDILNERSRASALAAAQKASKAKGDLGAALKKISVEITESGDLTPQSTIPQTGGMTPELREELFADHVIIGDRGAAQVPAGALVWEVTSRETFDLERFETEKGTLRDEVTSRRGAQLRQSIIERLRKDRKIEINSGLVQRFDG